MTKQARLNKDMLVTTALALADAEGLDAVTIRRLAQGHQVTPMAMYRHFADKDEILDALAARLLAEIVLPPADDRPWDVQMRDLLGAFVAALVPHPNTAGLVLTRVLRSDPGLALAERALGLLVGAGFTVEAAARVGTQALCCLVTLVMADAGPVHSADPEVRDAALRAKRAHLGMLSPRRYPTLVAAADALTTCAQQPDFFASGVDLIVAGMRGSLREEDVAERV
jgi:TetR/AcrR family transcriptional regulator, tetracycline repressor protein